MRIDLSTFVKLAEFAVPMFVPPALAPLVVHGLQLAESHPVDGAQKKAIALDAIKTGLEAVNAVKPGTVPVDEALKTASDGIDDTIATINAAHDRGLANAAPANAVQGGQVWKPSVVNAK